MAKEFKVYFGKRFYQDKKGYWVNPMPIHAQRWVWINHYGSIPEKMDIHHKDGDKGNNEICNLEMLDRSEHLRRHWKEGGFDLEKRRKQLSEARVWLKTPQGRKKQSLDAKEGWRKRQPFIKSCEECQREFSSYQKWAKFCSENCYARNRRKNKIGFVNKKCWICGNLFFSEKTSRVRTCGRSCGGKLKTLSKEQATV